MKEAELLSRVTETAIRLGWKCWHVPAPMRWTSKGWVGAKSAAGLADLILIHDDPPRLIFAELKGSGGKLSDAQQGFLQAAKNVADRSIDREDCDYTDAQESVYVGLATIGVYVVTPETEDAFVQVLRSKTLS